MLKNFNSALLVDEQDRDYQEEAVISNDNIDVDVPKGIGMSLALNEAIGAVSDESCCEVKDDPVVGRDELIAVSSGGTAFTTIDSSSFDGSLNWTIMCDDTNVTYDPLPFDMTPFKEFAIDTMTTYFAETRELVRNNELCGGAPLDSVESNAAVMSMILHDYVVLAFGKVPESRITDDSVMLSLVAQEFEMSEFLCFEDLGTNVIVDYDDEHVFYENHRFVHFRNGDTMLVESIDYVWRNGTIPEDRVNDIIPPTRETPIEQTVLDTLVSASRRKVWTVDVDLDGVSAAERKVWTVDVDLDGEINAYLEMPQNSTV